MKVVVHVDGGARGNPGPAAAAAVVSAPDGEVLAEAAERIGTATNNVAEYRGLLLGAREGARARRDGGRDRQRLRADRQAGQRRVQGQAPRHEAAARGGDGGAEPVRALVDPLRAARAERRRRRARQPGARRNPDGEAVDPAAGRAGGNAAREPTGGTDYASYLLIDDLLSLQRPITPGAHDELLFIVVHQSYELWFKLILHELERARDDLLARRPHVAAPRLRRVVEIERLLLKHLDVLETMSPDGFLEFRDPLAPASGFQSVQFRRIEWISGLQGRLPFERHAARGGDAVRGVPRGRRPAGRP